MPEAGKDNRHQPCRKNKRQHRFFFPFHPRSVKPDLTPLPINRPESENFESDWSDSRTMDSPGRYMNIVYKPRGLAERTRPRMRIKRRIRT